MREEKMSWCQDITFKRQNILIALTTASLHLMSFLMKGESKGGNMQTPIYKGQKNGKKIRIKLSRNIWYAKKDWVLYEVASMEKWNTKDDICDAKHLVNQPMNSL